MDQKTAESQATDSVEEAEEATPKTKAAWLQGRIQGNKDEFVEECRKSSGQLCDTQQILQGTRTF
jgi:hypothetical protein